MCEIIVFTAVPDKVELPVISIELFRVMKSLTNMVLLDSSWSFTNKLVKLPIAGEVFVIPSV